ncbi:MAG: pirin-like C-terminal cupin domain-containing protein [Solibacillus sp.]
MEDDKFARNTFADHPHKGIQMVTYVLEASLTHYASKTAGGGRLNEGDFQIMTAASGIIHNENPDRGEEVRVLQLWVNLSSLHKKLPGQYEDLPKEKVPIFHFDGGQIEVLAGEVDGVASPLTLFTPFQYAAVTLEDGQYPFPIPAGYNTYLYVVEGHLTVNGQQLNTFDMVHFEISETADTIELTASEHAKVVIFAGLPIQESIVAQGPFVMNTQEEIQEAFSSYRNGTFLNGTPY